MFLKTVIPQQKTLCSVSFTFNVINLNYVFNIQAISN